MNHVKNIKKNSIAIIGGGAVGTSLLHHLAQKLEAENRLAETEIFWFESRPTHGPGLAYQSDSPHLLLNRPVSTMSAVHDDLEHFHRWAVKHQIVSPSPQDRETFLPRSIFGLYLADLANQTEQKIEHAGGKLNRIQSEVVSIRKDGADFIITCVDGSVFETKWACLCLGNPKSKRFSQLKHHAGFIHSPYPMRDVLKKTDPRQSVVILGARLSAIDAALGLVRNGHNGPITLISKHGEIPSVRSPSEVKTHRFFTPKGIRYLSGFDQKKLTLNEIGNYLLRELGFQPGTWQDFIQAIGQKSDPIRYLEREITEAKKGSRDWQVLGIALNEVIETLWHHLESKEKEKFLNQYYSAWMAYRVPIPTVTAERLLEAMKEGKISVRSGFQSIRYQEGTQTFSIELRNQLRIESDLVIDATGTPRHLHEFDSPLIDQMVREGIVRKHPLGGMEVEFSSSKVMDEHGDVNPRMFSVGNLTFGTHLFTSVLELNVEKAFAIAEQITNQISIQPEENSYEPSYSLSQESVRFDPESAMALAH